MMDLSYVILLSKIIVFIFLIVITNHYVEPQICDGVQALAWMKHKLKFVLLLFCDGVQALAWMKHKLKFVLLLFCDGVQALAWMKHKLKFVLLLSHYRRSRRRCIAART
jgi:hypothetical protein